MDLFGQLPDEVLELILCYLSNYCDLHTCRLVNRRFLSILTGIIEKKQKAFIAAVTQGKVRCEYYCASDDDHIWPPHRMFPACCFYDVGSCAYDKCVYMFGGETSEQTMFSDFWRWDLPSRLWERVARVDISVVPPPRSGCKLIQRGKQLLLCGGLNRSTHHGSPSGSPLYCKPDVYVFDVTSKKWCTHYHRHVLNDVAVHSVCEMGDYLVFYGGVRYGMFGESSTSANEQVITFSMTSKEFQQLHCESPDVRPPCAPWSEQVAVDSSHILWYCGKVREGESKNQMYLMECDTRANTYKWVKLDVTNRQLSPLDLNFMKMCRVTPELFVSFSRGGLRRQAERKVRGRREPLRECERELVDGGGEGVSTGEVCDHTRASCCCVYCTHQVTCVDAKKTLRTSSSSAVSGDGTSPVKPWDTVPSMQMFCLDISGLLQGIAGGDEVLSVSWRAVPETLSTPGLCKGYDLLLARNEMVVVAGVFREKEKESHTKDELTVAVIKARDI